MTISFCKYSTKRKAMKLHNRHDLWYVAHNLLFDLFTSSGCEILLNKHFFRRERGNFASVSPIFRAWLQTILLVGDCRSFLNIAAVSSYRFSLPIEIWVLTFSSAFICTTFIVPSVCVISYLGLYLLYL